MTSGYGPAGAPCIGPLEIIEHLTGQVLIDRSSIGEVITLGKSEYVVRPCDEARIPEHLIRRLQSRGERGWRTDIRLDRRGKRLAWRA